MVLLVPFTQTAQYRYGVFHGRLINDYRLEPTLKRRIFLDMLPKLIQRCCANAVQFATRQHRLEQIARIHGAFSLARAHNRMQFVDEQNNEALAIGYFFQNGLKTFFKFTPIFGTGNQGAHIQRHDLFVFQAFGNIASHDPHRQSFSDGCFANTGFADQDRIVLGAARQNLNHSADLFVAADDRVELALFRHFGEVAAVFFKRLVRGFRILAGHTLATTNLLQGLHQAFATQAELLQCFPGSACIG